MAARASFIAGFDGTATTEASRLWRIPLYGTMAHAFVQAFDDEGAAFEAFARARPDELTLLIDTYDTEAGARQVVALAPRLRQAGITVRSVRLDSGDLLVLSRRVRRILDDGELQDVRIFASGGLDEHDLERLVSAGAPIDGFGMGTSLTTSSDAPALDCAYKLQEYANLPRRKLSPGKATWPGRKQVWRAFGADGRMAGDLLTLESAPGEGVPLLHPVMRSGHRIAKSPTLADIREHAALNLARLPPRLRNLQHQSYPVMISDALRRAAEDADRRRVKPVGQGS